MKKLGFIIIALSILSGCRPEPIDIPKPSDSPFNVEVPDGFDELPVPEDNELTVLKVELGKRLFFDKQLSGDFSTSCGSCHLPDMAFTDGLPKSIGFDGRSSIRNSPSLLNVAWQENLFAEGGVPNLELQVLAPFGDENEMNINAQELEERLGADESINALSESAYGINPINLFVITRAIASYERTLISGNSPYDAYANGDENALSELQKQGMELFNSEALACRTCHSGFLFTDQDYHNVGLYDEYEDFGRERITNLPEDRGKFKTPSLRNVAITAPYMHDGSIVTLAEVIEHFNQGGVGHPNQDGRVQALGLTDDEKLALQAFLESLSGAEYQ